MYQALGYTDDYNSLFSQEVKIQWAKDIQT